MSDLDDLLEARNRHISNSLSIGHGRPLHIVKGEMQYLFSNDGTRYLDLVNNVCHVGHCHPKVVAAGQKQMEILSTNTRYIYCLLYTSPSPRDKRQSRMPSSA